MDMLLLLSAPGRLLMDVDLGGEAIKVKGLHSGRMPWLVQSDVLFTNAREFVGIVLYAGDRDAGVAREFTSVCDPRIARYLSYREAVQVVRYRSILPRNTSVLELRWSPVEPDHEEVTQLDEYWYYSSAEPAADEYPCAWGYTQIENILASKRLTLPESLY